MKVIMKKLFLFLLLCGSFKLSFSGESNKKFEPAQAVAKMPKLKITSIANHTPYDLALIDRLNNNRLVIPAQRIEEFSHDIGNYQNVIINGSMKDCMASHAQFVLHPSNSTDDTVDLQDYYINFCLAPGGVNDGSGFITGIPGTLTSKFFMAGSLRGCNMSSSPLKKLENDENEVEVSLKLSIDQNNFNNQKNAIAAEYFFTTDKKVEKQVDTVEPVDTIQKAKNESIFGNGFKKGFFIKKK